MHFEPKQGIFLSWRKRVERNRVEEPSELLKRRSWNFNMEACANKHYVPLRKQRRGCGATCSGFQLGKDGGQVCAVRTLGLGARRLLRSMDRHWAVYFQ